MSKRNPTPIITHTEIYARAIRSLDAEIVEWAERAAGNVALLDQLTATLREKRDAVAAIYEIETGCKY